MVYVMRHTSFFLTTAQIRNRSKTVTRRLSSRYKAGELRQPVVKQQGLKKGEHVEKIGGAIRLTDVRRERLDAITPDDCAREGFPELTPAEFVAMFKRHNHCRRNRIVTRIQFEYV